MINKPHLLSTFLVFRLLKAFYKTCQHSHSHSYTDGTFRVRYLGPMILQQKKEPPIFWLVDDPFYVWATAAQASTNRFSSNPNTSVSRFWWQWIHASPVSLFFFFFLLTLFHFTIFALLISVKRWRLNTEDCCGVSYRTRQEPTWSTGTPHTSAPSSITFDTENWSWIKIWLRKVKHLDPCRKILLL